MLRSFVMSSVEILSLVSSRVFNLFSVSICFTDSIFCSSPLFLIEFFVELVFFCRCSEKFSLLNSADDRKGEKILDYQKYL